MQRKLIIGTRGSPLALYQANLVKTLLGHESKIKIFKTSGDRITGDLKDFGGKGLFTKELEAALINGDIDLAVHSMKDVPTISQEGLSIEAVLKREDPRDAFISYKVSRLMDLPNKAVVGTASIRRRAQLSAIRPDIQFLLLRGNVGTRIDKLKNGDCDATFLAVAGLNRLGEQGLITEAIEANIMLSAPAQGAIGIEIRKSDTKTKKIIASLNHYETEISVAAERSFLRALDGSCKTPIAALANYKDKTLNFRGEVISKDGTLVFSREVKQKILSIDEAISLGYKLGIDVRKEIGKKILWD